MDPNATRDFLIDVFGDKPEDEYILLWTLPAKTSAFFTDPDKATAWAQAVGSTQNVYIGVGSRRRDHGEHERGTTADVVSIFGLWADVDYADPVHQKAAKGALPPTEQDALTLIYAMPAAPTMVIHSGHGLQAWWLFIEPFTIEKETERTMITEISAAWQAHMRSLAAARGDWTVDSVWDLSRVMRLPGTENRKDLPPQPVRVIVDEGPRYAGPSDFLEWVERKPIKPSPQLASGEGLLLREDAEPNMALIDALKTNSPEFKEVWEYKRDDFASQSEYDQSLSDYMVMAGWDNQSIVDALIWHRRTNAAGPSKWKLREDYYARTIAKARNDHERQHQGANRKKAVKAHTGNDTTDETFQKLRTILLFPIARWRQHGRENAQYSAITSEGKVIHFGTTKDIRNQTSFFNRVFEEFGVLAETPLKTEEWNRTLNILSSVAEFVENEAARRDYQVAEWVRGYLSGSITGLGAGNQEERLEAYKYGDAIAQSRPFLRGGLIHIHTDPFKKWVYDQHAARLSVAEFHDALHTEGWAKVDCHSRTEEGRDVTRRYWCRSWQAVLASTPVDEREPELTLSG